MQPNAGVQRTLTAAWVGGCGAAAVAVRCNDSLNSIRLRRMGLFGAVTA